MRSAAILLVAMLILGAGLLLPVSENVPAQTAQAPVWEELISERTRTSKSFVNLANPSQRSWTGSIGPIHYESVRDSGVYDTEVNLTPQRVNNAKLDGWTVTNNGWHYALGQPGDKSTDGWVGFGGRQGDNWIKFRLARVGYLYGPTRAWEDLGGPPTYDRAQLSSTTSAATYGPSDPLTLQTTATWAKLWTTAGGGALNITWRANADGLKEDIIINQAAREWLAANRPPSTPAADTWFGFVLQVDWSDIPKAVSGGLEVDLSGDFTVTTENIELRDALDRLLAFMPISEVRVPTDDPLNPFDVRPLDKRFWLDGDGNHYVLMGIRVPELVGMAAGDLIFDPTVDEQVGAGADDGYSRSDESFTSTDTTLYFGASSALTFDNYERFTTVAIPNAATVDVAYLTVEASNSGFDGAGVRTNIYAEDADNPAAPTSWADLDGRARTTSFTAWDDEDFVVDTATNSPSIITAIQEIVDRSGWSSGNALQIIWEDDASDTSMNYRLYSYEGSTSRAIRLHVEYTSNTAPSIDENIVSDLGEVDVLYSRQLNATDPDTDTLLWTLTTAPAFLLIVSLNRTAYVNGTSSAGGQFAVNVTVSDQQSPALTDFDAYTLGITGGGGPGGTGGPGAGQISLITSAAYFGWNSVLLNADAVFEKSGGPDPDEVLFYRWDLGDGTIRTGSEITHSYSLRWIWSVYDVTLDVCTAQESVCETRSIPVLIVFWPAVYGLILVTLALLVLLARKVRWRIVVP